MWRLVACSRGHRQSDMIWPRSDGYLPAAFRLSSPSCLSHAAIRQVQQYESHTRYRPWHGGFRPYSPRASGLGRVTVTEREKRDCQKDYHAYCGDYGLGTEALRACMSRNIKKVSHACVGALVDAGEMTQSPGRQAAGIA